MKMPVNIYQRKPAQKAQINPIWRGIGCILMVLLPLVTCGLTVLFTPMLAATNLAPLELMGYIRFPEWAYRWPITADIANFIGSINNLGLDLVVFVAILVLIIGIASLIYVAVLQFIGPPRYTELDAPPSGYKPKKYTR